ncbi:hypothetical protein [Massilia sp. BHUDP2]|uniref:hypothetical protein n=1 Tax=Massilia sp. BHUDP2 TaxID=3034505 RepID=UPI0039068097
MTQDRRITDKLPGHPLQWDDAASPSAAPAAGQAGLAMPRELTDKMAEALEDAVRGEMSVEWDPDLGSNVSFGSWDKVYAALCAAAPVAADTEQATPRKVDASMISRYRYAKVMGVYEAPTGEYVKLEQMQALLRAAGIQLVTDGSK